MNSDTKFHKYIRQNFMSFCAHSWAGCSLSSFKQRLKVHHTVNIKVSGKFFDMRFLSIFNYVDEDKSFLWCCMLVTVPYGNVRYVAETFRSILTAEVMSIS